MAQVSVPAAPLPALVAEPTGTARGDVVLVPGFTGSKEDFIALVRPLADLGWRVASVDLPGQNGAPALGPRGSHTEASMARAVLGFLDWFAPQSRAHVVGHSMGGLLTRDLIVTAGPRLRSWSAMSSGPGALPAAGHEQLIRLQQSLDFLPLEVIWEFKEAGDRRAGWNPPAEVAEFCQRRFLSNDPAALHDCAGLLQTAPDRCEELAAAASSADLPLGVIAGETDDAWPLAVQHDMAQRLAATFVELPGVGHNPGVEDPQLTAEAIDVVCSGSVTG